MRILLANEKLGWFGGVEQTVADSARALRERGHEVHLAHGEQTPREPSRYAALFDSCAPCRELGDAAGEGLGAIARRVGAQVVYFHKIKRLVGRDERGAATRAVRMVHDHDLCCPRRHKYFVHNAAICNHPAGWRCYLDLAWVERSPSSPLGVAFRGLGPHRAELRRNRELDVCLVGSRFMKRELEMNGLPAARVEIIPPAVRREERAPTDAAEARHVLFVGQLIRGKGVDLLLEALARVPDEWTASIVGEGNARPALEEQARRLRLEGCARFGGWARNEEVDAHYAAARLLAVPARWPEPFGMIGLEAMHNARPVVAFPAGGIPDWLEDGRNGLLAPQNDVEALAACITRLLDDRELATRMGRAGWERARGEFNFDACIDRLEAALQRSLP
mgnify:CR=1 FL=1